MIGVRSLVFHLASWLVTLGFLLLWPLILAPRPIVWAIIRQYIRMQLLLLRVICGQRYRVLGAEQLPDAPYILAARHEALWETLVLPLVFDLPSVILKKEILGYPFAGTIARKMGFIGVDRSGSADSAKATFDEARRQAAEGRSIMIFPNGTRNPEHRTRVQGGVAVLYRALKLPCVPLVLDSGDFWPYRSWLRHPGEITVRLLPPIEAGLRGGAFMERLQSDLGERAA